MSDRSASLSAFPIRPSARDEPENDDLDSEQDDAVYKAFSLARGVKQFIPMLELRHCNGNARAFEYSMLEEVSFDPSEGVKLRFGQSSVLVKGRNLRPLFNGLVRHAVRWIRQAEQSVLFENSDLATVAESIQVQEEK